MMDRWLLLTWKRLLVIVVAWVLCVLCHNLIYALFSDAIGPDGDEPVFFILAVIVIPLYFVGTVFYTIVRLILKRNVK